MTATSEKLGSVDLQAPLTDDSLSWDESARLKALESYGVLDTPREPAFDDIVRLAADVFDAPIAVVNLIAEGRQWFKAEVGIGVDELPLDVSICAHAILQRDVMVVCDTRDDPRFTCNPLVTADGGLRFYAGAILETRDGLPIGTVCILDTKPRPQGITERQRLTLEVLARQVMSELELRRAVAQRDAEVQRARASEERLRVIVDSACDYAIITMDPDRRVTDWSKGAEAIFRCSSDEMIGQPADLIFTAEDRAFGRPQHEVDVAANEGCAPDVRWHERADGSLVFMNGSVHPLPRDKEGRERGFIKIARDETAQRADRIAILESEQRFRNMADNAPMMMWVTDASGYCLYLNQRWYEVTGQTADEAEGYGWLDATHPDDRPRAELAFVESNAAQAGFRVEYRLRRADGSYFWAIDAASPRFDDDGAYLGYVGSVIDIDERRRSEERLRESEEQLRLATEAAEVGLWDLNVGSDALFWPPRVKAMFGISADVPISMGDYYTGLHPDDAEQTAEAFAAALDPDLRALYDVEYRTIGKEDGVIRWVAAKGRGLFDESGTCVRVLGTAIDITAKKAIEARLYELNETLEQRVAEEVAERAKAEEQLRQSQKMEAVGQLTGGVAHDFNNLLTVIRGSIDLLRRPNVPEERRKRYTDAIADTADRATKLTNQLLAFARRQALKPEVFDAVESIRAIRDMVGTLTGSRISIALDLRAQPCFVNADRSQFDTAIVNMAVNARDAMQGEGELTIKVDAVSIMPANQSHPFVAGNFATIALTDTGVGIPNESLDRIFEPFFTTKGVGQGTGLGLSQVFGFAKQSGGDIRAESMEGQGTTFTLYLPLTDAPVETDGTSLHRGGLTLGEGACILVVEDNVEVGSFATHALSELGYKTVLAMDGPQALSELATSHTSFDVVFTDVMMPGMTGIELGQEVERLYPGVPVVLTSGYSSVLAENGTHGFELLHKPYSIEELSRVLRKIALR
jgi:PAS domain S-box-containing protein